MYWELRRTLSRCQFYFVFLLLFDYIMRVRRTIQCSRPYVRLWMRVSVSVGKWFESRNDVKQLEALLSVSKIWKIDTISNIYYDDLPHSARLHNTWVSRWAYVLLCVRCSTITALYSMIYDREEEREGQKENVTAQIVTNIHSATVTERIRCAIFLLHYPFSMSTHAPCPIGQRWMEERRHMKCALRFYSIFID